MAPGLGRVANRLDVTLVQVLEPRQPYTQMRRLPGARVEIAFDLDDRRRRIAHLPEELQAYRADCRWQPVQDEARRGDDAVATLLLHTGQSGEELVGDVLAQPRLAKARAGNAQRFLALECA